MGHQVQIKETKVPIKSDFDRVSWFCFNYSFTIKELVITAILGAKSLHLKLSDVLHMGLKNDAGVRRSNHVCTIAAPQKQ